MCVRFAYYVKSLAKNKNGTSIVLNSVGRIGGILWETKLDDSQGWQTVTSPVKEYAVLEEFYSNNKNKYFNNFYLYHYKIHDNDNYN